MASLPANVSFFMSRLQGVSTSHFKIHGQSGDSGTSGKIMRFELPSNSYVNLRNLRMFFGVTLAGEGASMPNDVSSFIDRVSVYAGGVLVSNNFQGYNVLRHAKAGLEGQKCNSLLSHPNIVRETSYHNGAVFGNTAPESYAALDAQFCIDNWEGILGSIEPSIIDTGLLPQMMIEIQLADDTVCPISAGRVLPDGAGTKALNFDKVGSGNPTYTLTNMNMQVEVLGFATSVLDEIISQRIQAVGYLSLPFTNYFSSVSRHDGTTRFSVNSASWDKLWVTYRATTYAAKAAPAIATGFKKAGGYVSSVEGTAFASPVDVGVVDFETATDTNREKYLSKYFQFKEIKSDTAAPCYFQLQVNSASVPAYRMTLPEALSMTLGAVDSYDTEKNMTLEQYRQDHFVQVYRFNLPDSSVRNATGLDSRSISAVGMVETTNIAESNMMLFAQTTSELRVGAGRSIEIVQ